MYSSIIDLYTTYSNVSFAHLLKMCIWSVKFLITSLKSLIFPSYISSSFCDLTFPSTSRIPGTVTVFDEVLPNCVFPVVSKVVNVILSVATILVMLRAFVAIFTQNSMSPSVLDLQSLLLDCPLTVTLKILMKAHTSKIIGF